jgi:tRNA threonylcarbamoyl adenosine modification protein (Sua5/YciO/YrdC/YwlC family)
MNKHTSFVSHCPQALLDYVWYDPTRLHVTKQLPVPAEQLLASFIPSPNFPSDHLAVVYDLAFKPSAKPQGSAAAAAEVPGQQGFSASGVQQHDSATFTLLPASEDHVTDAVAALNRGDVIALPTDTLYGLAAAAGNAAAVQQLRAIKQRAPSAPFAVTVADVEDVQRYCVTEQLPQGLLRALLPGPVTVLLPLRPDADLAQGVLQPNNSSSSSNTAAAAAAGPVVGVRVVPNEFVRGVCRQLGGGIALTSANLSGAESSLCIHDFR